MKTSGPKRYDSCLSYNSHDRRVVAELAERLKGEGLALRFAEWEALPGEQSHSGLGEALNDSESCVVFVGPSGLEPSQLEELQLVINKRVRDSEFHVVPVLLPGAERPRWGTAVHLESLMTVSWVEFGETTDDRQTFDNLVAEIKGTKRDQLRKAKRRRRRRFLIGAMIAATAGPFFWREATRRARIAESQRLAALSSNQLPFNLDLALLLAVEATRADNTSEAMESLSKSLAAQPGLVSFLHMDRDSVSDIAFSPDGNTLAAGYREYLHERQPTVVKRGGVVLWDTTRHTRIQDRPLVVTEGTVASVAFSPDGKMLAAGYGYGGGVAGVIGGGGVVLWGTTRRTRIQDQPLIVAEGDVWTVAFSPDGKTLAAGFAYGGVNGSDNGVVLWDMARRTRIQNLPLVGVDGHLTSLAFSPDGKALAAGYSYVGRGGVALWGAVRSSHVQHQSLAVPEGFVTSVVFSPDSKTLTAGCRAIGDRDGGVVLWDTARLVRIQDQPLAVTEGDVSRVAFSPDGKMMAACYSGAGRGRGSGIVFWDTSRYARIHVVPPVAATASYVTSLAFRPDGKTLATNRSRNVHGGEGGGRGVVLWDTTTLSNLNSQPLAMVEGRVTSRDLASWRRQAGAIANRNLTRAEWRAYFPGKPYRKTFDWHPEAPAMEPTTKPPSTRPH